MTSTARVLIVTLVSFTLYFILDEAFFPPLRAVLKEWVHFVSIAHVITYVLLGVPLLAAALLMHEKENYFYSLGLHQPIKKPLIAALAFTLPMLIGYAIFFDFNTQISMEGIITGAICAAFFEELYFRGILFGQIYRFTNIGFIPAILIGAILFASVHLYQSQELGVLIGIFITTFLGAILFAWTFIEWEDNLWMPIFLHFFMNLFWMLFSAGDNAFGGLYANIFRSITIAFIIIGTIYYKKRNKIPLEITRKSLWMKSQMP